MNTEQIKEVAESLCNLTSDYVHGSLHAEADNHWKAGLMQVILLRLERLLGGDNATDHGAAIEAAAKQTIQDIEQRLSLETRQQIIARHMRALVATVTNSQQKGGEQREALATPQPATAKEATVRSGDWYCCTAEFGQHDPTCPNYKEKP